ncbi:MAG: hypothetical protein ACFCD0_26765 [Gemmataceae bacterium]
MSQLVQSLRSFFFSPVKEIQRKLQYIGGWEGCREPRRLFNAIASPRDPRKCRLRVAGGARRLMHLMPEGPYRAAVEVAEKFADEVIGIEELRDAWRQTEPIHPGPGSDVLWLARHTVRPEAEKAVRKGINCAMRSGEKLARADLVRDLFGKQFHPEVQLGPWLSDDVMGVARMIYDQNRFDHMPILADALEESGCDSETVLDHCRGGHHARGCWVVDQILGKT